MPHRSLVTADTGPSESAGSLPSLNRVVTLPDILTPFASPKAGKCALRRRHLSIVLPPATPVSNPENTATRMEALAIAPVCGIDQPFHAPSPTPSTVTKSHTRVSISADPAMKITSQNWSYSGGLNTSFADEHHAKWKLYSVDTGNVCASQPKAWSRSIVGPRNDVECLRLRRSPLWKERASQSWYYFSRD
ncbi:hypothetical protein BWQ96_06263 [Gracilariopsis chorda]|uniref:Uncharacterized protein n=1 Tax=Gracilariopsis chorda TaxID=448386 RepID=A0A2V3IPK4_9FLOR|nr:hypothetical protein BWQ96_06263 [Gracilariopsis chorda]|eukprot:PXF43987.1 hypothetical protein BWQ96_06263 [Gracilariopsis chorda]